jgi:DNA-binding GntR family transcriptional regulator
MGTVARPTVELASSATPRPLPIDTTGLEDRVYKQFRAMIVERHILPGDRLQVDELAREMGVSRTPLVAALKRLAHENAVDFAPRRGVFVKRLTNWEIARLFEVREMLEGLSARRAATRISSKEVAEFREIFQEIDLASTTEALAHYTEQDQHFHLRLVEIADNPFLTRAIDSVNLMIFTYQHGISRSPQESVQEHLQILEALDRHDPDASEAAMRLHLRRARERYDREADEEKAVRREKTQAEAMASTPRE